MTIARRTTLLVLLSLLVPAAAQASHTRPIILGDWDVQGVGLVRVGETGPPYAGKLLTSQGCNRKGREIWKGITDINGSWFQGTATFYRSPGTGDCEIIGQGKADWTFPTSRDSGMLCAVSPDTSARQCLAVTRHGKPRALPPEYAIDSFVLSCLRSPRWYQRKTRGCTQRYHVPQPGEFREVMLFCPDPVGVSFGCPRPLVECLERGYRYENFVCRAPDGSAASVRAAASAKKKRRVRQVVVSTAAHSFEAPGEAGILVQATRTGSKALKKLAKRRKRLGVVIVSTFKPAAGRTVGRSRKATLKLR
jgi:hypothetical protein